MSTLASLTVEQTLARLILGKISQSDTHNNVLEEALDDPTAQQPLLSAAGFDRQLDPISPVSTDLFLFLGDPVWGVWGTTRGVSQPCCGFLG